MISSIPRVFPDIKHKKW